jgi:hypothetical protein
MLFAFELEMLSCTRYIALHCVYIDPVMTDSHLHGDVDEEAGMLLQALFSF